MTYKHGQIRKNYSGSYDAFVNGVCVSMTVGVDGAKEAITSNFVEALVRSAVEGN